MNLLLKGRNGKLYKRGTKDIVFGVSSRIGNKHLVMLDYDNKTIKYVKRKVRMIQRFFYMPSFYIFRSSLKSYHAICFILVSRRMLRKIFKKSCTDKLHQLYPDRVGYGTLRISRKRLMPSSGIKFMGRVANDGAEREDLRQEYFMLLGFENGS